MVRLKAKKSIPFGFVLDELESLSPYTKPMFGCTAIYVGDQIILVIRERDSHPEDNGIWVATEKEHHTSLRNTFPALRSIALLGASPTNWQVLPSDDSSFEEAAFGLCKLILKRDPRIGKIPAERKKKKCRS